jgi:quercetin dioxygenase-like cupin family protein
MNIKRSGLQPSATGPAEWFTGSVRIDSKSQGSAPARVGAASIFEPGARTARHTHPLAQTLIVNFGCGLVQREDGPIDEIRPGDVVWLEPSEKHWHGASPTTAMTYIAIVRADPWSLLPTSRAKIEIVGICALTRAILFVPTSLPVGLARRVYCLMDVRTSVPPASHRSRRRSLP